MGATGQGRVAELQSSELLISNSSSYPSGRRASACRRGFSPPYPSCKMRQQPQPLLCVLPWISTHANTALCPDPIQRSTSCCRNSSESVLTAQEKTLLARKNEEAQIPRGFAFVCILPSPTLAPEVLCSLPPGCLEVRMMAPSSSTALPEPQ